ASGLYLVDWIAANDNRISCSVIPRIPHLRQDQLRRRILACSPEGSSQARHPDSFLQNELPRIRRASFPENSPAEWQTRRSPTLLTLSCGSSAQKSSRGIGSSGC